MAHGAKKYLKVFFVLLVLTVVTVAASNLKIGIAFGIILALIIALVKGSLVACHFMHLNSEKRIIYFVLILAVIFVLAMMILTYVMYFNVPEGVHHVT